MLLFYKKLGTVQEYFTTFLASGIKRNPTLPFEIVNIGNVTALSHSDFSSIQEKDLPHQTQKHANAYSSPKPREDSKVLVIITHKVIIIMVITKALTR